MTATMSDTPRTDAAVTKFIKRTYTGACECVDAEDMRQLERENEALRKDAERVLIATAHYHVQSHDGNDTCKECGLNLRDKIHFPKYIDLRRAAIKEQSHE